MERRGDPRRVRRVGVKFWEPGSQTAHQGFSTNISNTGMFIATSHPVPQGNRVRLEVCTENNGFVVEAKVARTRRSVQALQSVRHAGMGVRFLGVEDLVGELFPDICSERAPAPKPAPRPAAGFRVRYPTLESFLEVYRRDISTGGLFVPTGKPAPLNEVVTIAIGLQGDPMEPLQLKARVVHRLEPNGTDMVQGANLMSGMGVELLDPAGARETVGALLRQLGADLGES